MGWIAIAAVISLVGFVIMNHWGKYAYSEGVKAGIEIGLGLARGESFEDLVIKHAHYSRIE